MARHSGAHWENYINDPDLGDGWYVTSFEDITGDPFGSDAVWLGLHSPREAADRIQAMGYNAAKTYYFLDNHVVGFSTFKQVLTFTAAVTSRSVYGYTSMDIGSAGQLSFEDITNSHIVPTATADSPDILVDRGADTLWLKTEDYIHTSPPSSRRLRCGRDNGCTFLGVSALYTQRLSSVSALLLFKSP